MRGSFILVSILFLSVPAYGVSYYIPDDYGTIQGAIDASSGGDTLIVRCGAYYENIDFKGKAITMKSEQGAANTIIDGSQIGSVVICTNGEGSDTVLEGFTLQNGSASYGGGMYNGYSSTPTVFQCTFQGNSADLYGGGMYNYNLSSPTVTHCTFLENSAKRGGGLCNSSSLSPTVTHCIFQGNSATYCGGGMINFGSTPTVTQCTFQENSAEAGGGMYNDGASPTVTNCSFIRNSAINFGGGMVAAFYSSPTLTNCTFLENSSTHYGGGIANLTSTPIVTNCILWNDLPEEIYNNNSSPVITYSCIAGGYPGIGNIASDPLFLNQANTDLRLMIHSPCIDVGTNSAPMLPAYDFEGDARIVDGNGNGSAIVDMGIDEWSLRSEIRVDDDWSGLSYGDPVGGYIYGHDAFHKIQDGIDLIMTGGTVHVADGTYTGVGNRNLDFNGRALTVKSENGPHGCIIDCEQLGRGFYFHNQEGHDSRVEGFTLYNGAAVWYGGGISIEAASPTVTDCTFLQNSAVVGGGMCIFHEPSCPIVTQCTFQGNSVDQIGAGMCNGYGGSSTVIDCTFLENSSVYSGGGMCNYGGSSPEVLQCTFQGNSAINGGGICNYDICSPTVTQCTFHGNSAYDGDGGGIYNYDSSPLVTNCILWGDTPYEIDSSNTLDITHSCIEGGYFGVGNIDSDPLFIDAANYDLRLTSASPCIDAGDNSAPLIPVRDFEGDVRFFPGNGKGFKIRSPEEAVVDMGVDEYCLMKKSGAW